MARVDDRTHRRAASGAATPAGSDQVVLRDGSPAVIRPLLPDDAETLRTIFRGLSAESRRRRFLNPIDELDEPMLRRLLDDVDGNRHIALVLTVGGPGRAARPVADARLIQDADDPSTAEIAVTVVDEWQGRGAGTELSAALLRRTPPTVHRVRTMIAADNRPAVAMLARLGLSTPEPTIPGMLGVTVDLDRRSPAPERGASGDAA